MDFPYIFYQIETVFIEEFQAYSYAYTWILKFVNIPY